MGIPLLAAEKLMKKYGAERVSEDAKTELVRYLEDYLMKISLKAARIAKHSKRKTIKDSDIKIAAS